MIARRAMAGDAPAMAEILNRIIAIGGTTAHQVAKTAEAVRVDYVDGAQVIASVVAEDQGRVIGWQSVAMWEGEGHIGTFVQPGLQAKGVGAALFALTCDIARAAGIASLVASIRADNLPGLAYYARIGFVDFAADADFALPDGRVVGRVHRRFIL